MWEERFEQRYGFWRGFVDGVVNAYLDCGLYESGFARVKCSACSEEFLVATSCQKRGFCPSCGAKRAAAFAAFLADEVLEQVGHTMFTFSLPKMIRPYFIHHPELRGKLCRAAYETVQEMMAAAAIGCDGFRTGMVAITATAGDLLNDARGRTGARAKKSGSTLSDFSRESSPTSRRRGFIWFVNMLRR